MWDRRADGWWVRSLNFIHSRRIAWPDQEDWSAHIWDQGSVMPFAYGVYPTERLFGLRVEDYPGKFLLHTPQLRADYPTREGLARIVGWWMAIKLIGARGASEYVERFGKPWAYAVYATGEEGLESKPRAATREDIAQADAVLRAIGIGSLAGAVIPDSIKLTLAGPGLTGPNGAINHEKLIALCDEQMSKAVRGGTLQADAGDKGARSLGEVHEHADVRNARFDAACLSDTLKRDLVWWLCHLNYPGEEDLCPGVTVHVERIDPDALLERIIKLAGVNLPIDGRKVAEILGVPLLKPDDPDAIRLAPIKPSDLFALLPSAAHNLADALEAVAAMVGVQLTPAMKSSLSELDRDDAARLLQALLGAAKRGAKAETEAGATAEGAGDVARRPTSPRQPEEALTPEEPVTRRGVKPAPSKTKPAKRPRGATTPAPEE
jgi:phage gp29-like protein